MTDVVIQQGLPTPDQISQAVAVLRDGGLVAMPTETVYGLAADARNPEAVKRIFAAKGRPADHPLIVHIADHRQLDAWCAEVPDAARRLAEAFWPGPLTLILKRDARVLDAVTGGQSSIGLRVPAHPVALALLRAFGDGLAAPSANRFGHVSPTTAAHVHAELGNAVDLVLDGGACAIGIESTIVDLTAGQPRILRPGGITRARIEAVLGTAIPAALSGLAGVPRVSGALPSHYAPHTPLRWAVPTAGATGLNRSAVIETAGESSTVGIIAIGGPDEEAALQGVFSRLEWRSLPAEPEAYAQRIYAELRELDALGLDLILLEAPPDTAEWEAVRDRLQRAAGKG